MKLFVERGADVNDTCRNKEEKGGTAIHFAVVSERFEIVKFLVEQCRVHVDKRCLKHAAEQNQSELLVYLQQKYNLQKKSALSENALREHNRIREASSAIGEVSLEDDFSDEGLGENSDLEDLSDLEEGETTPGGRTEWKPGQKQCGAGCDSAQEEQKKKKKEKKPAIFLSPSCKSNPRTNPIPPTLISTPSSSLFLRSHSQRIDTLLFVGSRSNIFFIKRRENNYEKEWLWEIHDPGPLDAVCTMILENLENYCRIVGEEIDEMISNDHKIK